MNKDIINDNTDNIINDPDCKDKIGLTEIYNDFKSWSYKNAGKNKKLPDRNQLRSYFEKIYGIYDINKGWRGLKFKGDAINE